MQVKQFLGDFRKVETCICTNVPNSQSDQIQLDFEKACFRSDIPSFVLKYSKTCVTTSEV